MVMSLPVNNAAVILSRLTMLYIMNLLIGIIAMIPAVIIYGMNTTVSARRYLKLMTALLFKPVIPIL